MTAPRYNIFKDFYETKEIINKNAEGLYNDKHLKLIATLEKFFQSGIWAKNDTEKLMFYRANSDLTSAQLANLINVNQNTYRATLSRLNTRLRKMLFLGMTLSDVCTSQNSEIIEKTRSVVEFLLMRFDFYSEMPSYMITKINDYCISASDDTFNEEDIFSALFFLGRFSEVTFNESLKHIKPAALKYVMQRLSGDKYTEEMSYFKNCQVIASKPQKMQQSYIERVKNGK